MEASFNLVDSNVKIILTLTTGPDADDRLLAILKQATTMSRVTPQCLHSLKNYVQIEPT